MTEKGLDRQGPIAQTLLVQCIAWAPGFLQSVSVG